MADDPALLNAATANFAGLSRCPAREDARISIRLRWNDLATAKVSFAVSVKGSRMTLAGEGILGRADAETGTAECSISRAYRGDAAALAEIGETLLLFLLTRAGRVPIHAAAVMIGDRAVLLAGRSGSGKSSLALAAQKEGLEVLSEDTAYIQLVPELTIWGWPGAIHLHAADAPEGDFPQRTRGGRVKSAIPRGLTTNCATRAIVVALVPSDTLRLEPLAADRLLSLLSPSEAGFSLLRREAERALRALADEGAWRLTLNKHPQDAITLLREQFGGASPPLHSNERASGRQGQTGG
jgi:hypothetical protein